MGGYWSKESTPDRGVEVDPWLVYRYPAYPVLIHRLQGLGGVITA